MGNYNYLTSQGVITVDTSTIQTDVENEYKAALGNDLVVTPDTPQGAQIAAEVSARVSVLNSMAAIANQINPNITGGVFADALCALMMLERDKASKSIIYGVTVAGTPGFTLPINSQATMSTTLDAFVSMASVTFDPSTGSAVVDFEAVNAGPVACPVGELDTVSDVLGWETVNNSSSAIIGVTEQSDASLLAERKLTLGKQGVSTPEAQQSGLSAVDGVFSISYRDNFTGSTATIDGIVLVANSVWACVNGGSDIDVATALQQNKTDGAAWNGAHTLAVVDPFSGQSYTVKWDRTTLIPIQVRVTVHKNSDPSNPSIVIPQSVTDYASGLIPKLSGFLNGAAVSPFEISKAIGFNNPLFTIDKVEVSLVSSVSWQTTEIAMALNQAATVSLSAVTVIPL